MVYILKANAYANLRNQMMSRFNATPDAYLQVDDDVYKSTTICTHESLLTLPTDA